MKNNNNHVVYGWQKQSIRPPIEIDHADGIHVWDAGGRRYADFASGQFNVNVGYSHARVLAAMHGQMTKAAYVAPMFSTEARSVLAEMITEHTPPGLDHVFFCNSGSEAIETAIKVVRAATGRSKIYSAWQSYHGATYGAAGISGDPRREFVEPLLPGVSKFHYPTCYRCPFGEESPESCHFACLQSLKNQITHDGPETVAAIFLEPIVGTSGGYCPPPQFLSGVREFCDQHGILLVCDETLCGWGRCGHWFVSNHFGILPDIITTAKGLTSGYVPLGATIVRREIYEKFLERTFVGGLTYEGHVLACAAGIANLQIYEDEDLIDRSWELGDYMQEQLLSLAGQHHSVGDVRCNGLFACIELSAERDKKMPLAGHRDFKGNVSKEITERFRSMDLIVLAKWDFIFLGPPLIVSLDQIDDALCKVDDVLSFTDTLAG